MLCRQNPAPGAVSADSRSFGNSLAGEDTCQWDSLPRPTPETRRAESLIRLDNLIRRPSYRLVISAAGVVLICFFLAVFYLAWKACSQYPGAGTSSFHPSSWEVTGKVGTGPGDHRFTRIRRANAAT